MPQEFSLKKVLVFLLLLCVGGAGASIVVYKFVLAPSKAEKVSKADLASQLLEGEFDDQDLPEDLRRARLAQQAGSQYAGVNYGKSSLGLVGGKLPYAASDTKEAEAQGAEGGAAVAGGAGIAPDITKKMSQFAKKGGFETGGTKQFASAPPAPGASQTSGRASTQLGQATSASGGATGARRGRLATNIKGSKMGVRRAGSGSRKGAIEQAKQSRDIFRKGFQQGEMYAASGGARALEGAAGVDMPIAAVGALGQAPGIASGAPDLAEAGAATAPSNEVAGSGPGRGCLDVGDAIWCWQPKIGSKNGFYAGWDFVIGNTLGYVGQSIGCGSRESLGTQACGLGVGIVAGGLLGFVIGGPIAAVIGPAVSAVIVVIGFLAAVVAYIGGYDEYYSYLQVESRVQTEGDGHRINSLYTPVVLTDWGYGERGHVERKSTTLISDQEEFYLLIYEFSVVDDGQIDQGPKEPTFFMKLLEVPTVRSGQTDTKPRALFPLAGKGLSGEKLGRCFKDVTNRIERKCRYQIISEANEATQKQYKAVSQANDLSLQDACIRHHKLDVELRNCMSTFQSQQ